MTLSRFYVPNLANEPSEFNLPAEEAKHACQVLRCSPGNSLSCFDGQGHEILCEVVAVSKRTVVVRKNQVIDADRELPQDVEVLCALPKGERQRFLIEGLVQLGVKKFSPLNTERGVVSAKASTLERIRRQVIEASKQCGRNHLMQIGEAISVPQAIQGLACADKRLNFAHPYALTIDEKMLVAKPKQTACDAPAVCMIGPEGGFSDREVEQLAAQGWHPCQLGPRILRIEMAAISWVSRLLNVDI